MRQYFYIPSCSRHAWHKIRPENHRLDLGHREVWHYICLGHQPRASLSLGSSSSPWPREAPDSPQWLTRCWFSSRTWTKGKYLQYCLAVLLIPDPVESKSFCRVRPLTVGKKKLLPETPYKKSYASKNNSDVLVRYKWVFHKSGTRIWIDTKIKNRIRVRISM